MRTSTLYCNWDTTQHIREVSFPRAQHRRRQQSRRSFQLSSLWKTQSVQACVMIHVILNDRSNFSTVCVRLSRKQKIDLSVRGIPVGSFCPSFRIAHVFGEHFRCGEWGSHRCGSVVTTFYDGRSRYCVVDNFIRVRHQDFACVRWFTKPFYPFAPNPLVCRVSLMSPARNALMPSLLPLTDVAPTQVIVEPDVNNFYMMRVKGFDRLGRP